MGRHFVASVAVGAACLLPTAIPASGQSQRPQKEALQAFNDLIGSWRGTAVPAGTKDEQQRNFWTETITWQWQFKDKDVWLSVAFDKSKHFTKGTLRYLPDKDQFVLKLINLANEERAFSGQLSDKILTLDSPPDGKGDVERVVVTLLHDNRYLYRLDKKKAERTSFTNVFKVGATKEGVAFAAGSGKPECIVSGGLGTVPVEYLGKTYYVCCSGCASEFRADPAKYVKDYEEKKAKKDKK
jgi:YHS domain